MVSSAGISEIITAADADRLAALIAERLLERLAAAQAARGTASVVLTGGGIGIATLKALASASAGSPLDWSKVDVWWGDERFVAADDEERNELGARTALLDHVNVDPDRVHPMASTGTAADPEQGATDYRAALAAAAAAEPYGQDVPRFDVLLLGIGPEGHVASIFPHSPASRDERSAFAVHDCPKPPPTRISLGFGALQAAHEVWVLAAGEGKAAAIGRLVRGADPAELPAAGAVGREVTVVFADLAAATELP